MDTQKTYKREVAVGMLLFLAGLFLAGIIFPETLAIEAAKFLTTPIMLFASGAYGLDALAKQLR